MNWGKGIAIFLVLMQPDFGSSLVLMVILLVMIFLSGIELKYLAGMFVIGLIIAVIGWFFLADYQKNRLINFVDPSNDPRGSGYNVIQSVIAVGSGGVNGKGLGHGSQSQLNFLPEKHTDFIFSVIGEEFGFIGIGILLILFLFLLWQLINVARDAKDNYGSLVVIGIVAMFFFHIFENVGMTMGLMPITGIPLPFISYGGSAMVSSIIAIGFIINVDIRKKKIKF
jgi:rod shape determining protein RodA